MSFNPPENLTFLPLELLNSNSNAAGFSERLISLSSSASSALIREGSIATINSWKYVENSEYTCNFICFTKKIFQMAQTLDFSPLNF